MTTERNQHEVMNSEDYVHYSSMDRNSRKVDAKINNPLMTVNLLYSLETLKRRLPIEGLEFDNVCLSSNSEPRNMMKRTSNLCYV